MKLSTLFLTSLILISINTKSQSNAKNAIYLGHVDGKSKVDFFPKEIPITSDFELTKITESKNYFELRLYQQYQMHYYSYCTILSFDSIWKISKLKCIYDSVSKTKILTQVLESNHFNIDSAILLIQQNNLLSFPSVDNYKISEVDYIANGISELDRKIIFGGAFYTFEYKFRDEFNRFSWDNPEFFSKEHPNNNIFKLETRIIKLLGR